VTAVASGSGVIRATVENQSSTATLTIVAPKPPADTTTTSRPPPTDTSKSVPSDATVQLPVLLNTLLATTPSLGRTINVVDLQRAMDTTIYGDRLVMACGSTWPGNLIIRPASGPSTQWRTVTTDCPFIPAEGVRIGIDSTQKFASIVSPNVLPAIATNGPAARVRFIGVEVTTTAATNQGLILGCPNDCEKTLADQPSDIIIDRSYVHAPTSTDVRRCVALNGARLALIDPM
jgi:hypothetical protein